MSAVSGQGTTFNLPNYVGELFHLTPKDTIFLSMIGGIHGGVPVHSKDFTWQTDDNPTVSQPAITEGQDPTYGERDRAEVNNVVQIFQHGVEVNYTKQATTGQLGTPLAAATAILGNQPVQSELDHQVMLKTMHAAREVDYTFLLGTFQRPTDNTTARKTRGLVTATTTNVVATSGTPQLAKSHVDELFRTMWAAGAPLMNAVILVNGYQKQRFSDIYGYAPMSRNVGGLNIEQIETDFGTFGIALERHLTTSVIQVAELSVCKPRFLTIPDRGHFFLEEKAASGASRKFMLYGEMGLEYGPELWHGKITGLATA